MNHQEDIPQNASNGEQACAVPAMNLCINEIINCENEVATHDESEFVSLDINEIQQQCGKMSSMTSTSIEIQKEKLRQKELELDEMAKKLEEKYGNGSNSTTSSFDDNSNSNNGKKMNKQVNWPHEKFAYLHHDIENDIPIEMQSLVYTAYRTWKLTALGSVLNLITIGFAAFHDNYYESGLQKSQSLFTSLLWVGIAVPMGFLLWYMHLYRLCRKYSTKKWLVFTVSFACHILFSVIILSGCPWYPCAGIFMTLTCFFSGAHVSTAFGFLNCIVWFAVCMLSISIYRNCKAIFINPVIPVINQQTSIQNDLKSKMAAIAMNL